MYGGFFDRFAETTESVDAQVKEQMEKLEK